jgi:hypothetical protein
MTTVYKKARLRGFPKGSLAMTKIGCHCKERSGETISSKNINIRRESNGKSINLKQKVFYLTFVEK